MGGIGRAFNLLHCHIATLPTLLLSAHLPVHSHTHKSDKTHTSHTHTHTYIIYNQTSKKDKQKDKQGMAWHDRSGNELNSCDFSFSNRQFAFTT